MTSETGESLSRIVPVPVSAPILRVNVSVFSTTVSSIVEYVTVKLDSPWGTNIVVPDASKVTPLEKLGPVSALLIPKDDSSRS